MASEVTSVTCHTANGNVYVRDQRGGLIDVLSFPSSNIQAQSFGNGISVVSGTLCYTYMLENGKLRQTGVHAV